MLLLTMEAQQRTVTVSTPFSILALIWSIFAFSGSPGTSTLNTWASGVSFQSIRAFANAEVSRAEAGTLVSEEVKRPSSGSQMSRENGSKTSVRRPPKMLGMSDIVITDQRILEN
ncbi:hypothetical protein NL676_032709 [Syzygium grande]|nr:hypothetical protein NL676_032709 [Syzygium grande]